MSSLVQMLEAVNKKTIQVTIDGTPYTAKEGTTIVQILNHNKIEHPQICYIPDVVDPIQTCDTCIVEADGKLVRS